ncbi:cyclic nucleotide-gated ion channel 1-like [Phragmites australis]|uniref:cyclic nucleotide-gated ion channel 1-like n=1 Tax=Phragmites australis TaxID=29695 RepID=UPI002D791AD2|nr:cyclic nucleotide-gated ion channel 1-like [Phragmites australis]
MAVRGEKHVRFQDSRSEQSIGSDNIVSDGSHHVFGSPSDRIAGAFSFAGNSSHSETMNKSASDGMKSKARVLDPQGPFLQRWNKIFVISCFISVSVDSLFLYTPEVDGDNNCLYLDEKLEIIASILRSLTDIFYLLRIIFQFRTGFIAPSGVFGRGVLVEDTFAIATRYLSTYFLIDFLAVLPLPQVFVLLVLSHLQGSDVMKAKNILMLIIICQYVPRLIRIIPLYLQITRSAGTIMDTAWAGAAFNLLIYMLASHVLGALWYILSIQRQDTCWREACNSQDGCDLASLYCGSTAFENNTFLQDACPINGTDNPDLIFGIYQQTLQNVSQSTSFFEKLFFCFWWGLQNLCSCGQNLKTSTYTSENLFAVFVSTSGLVLFALLIGNVQTYLQSASVHIEEARVKRRDTEQWMAHRLLPECLKEQILRHEQYRWQETQGVDEESLLMNLPKDLRREIKRHLSLSLLMRVKMFENMDEQLLDAMCDRLKPMLYTEGSCIIREGDPVTEMLFIMRGTLESMTTNGGQIGFFNSDVLRGGDFCGEELLTWAIDPTSSSNLPGSTRTAKTLSEVEGFALRADDLKFVATQFRRLHSKQLRHTFRFYSQQWRTWAACFIQAAWHRYCRKKMEDTLNEKEKVFRAAIVSDDCSSLSLGAALYVARFACNMMRFLRRNATRNNARLQERVIVWLLQKPAEPNFFAEER